MRIVGVRREPSGLWEKKFPGQEVRVREVGTQANVLIG